jgi:hypothetical protein
MLLYAVFNFPENLYIKNHLEEYLDIFVPYIHLPKNSFFIFLCNINLLVVVHLCPAVPTHEKTAALIAISKSASSATVNREEIELELYICCNQSC